MSDYNSQMLEAFVQKNDKLEFYKTTFANFDSIKSFTKKWKWSWMAFLGSFWFFLYRKSYINALMLFIICALVSFIPILMLIVFILNGGFAMYFIHKTYKDKKLKYESTESEDKMRIALMKYHGGVHFWVIPVYFAFVILSFVQGLMSNVPN